MRDFHLTRKSHKTNISFMLRGNAAVPCLVLIGCVTSPPHDDDAESGSDMAAVCGDAVIHDGESCDDGNTVDGDGCNSDCRASGSTQWCLTLPDSESMKLAGAHVADMADGVLVGATTTDGPVVAISLAYLSADGESQWTRTIAADGEMLHLERLVPNADRTAVTIVARATDESMVESVWLAEVDEMGETTEPASLTSAGQSLIAYSGHHIDHGSADGLLLGGLDGSMGWLARLDTTRQLVWEQRFSYQESTLVSDVAELTDGRIAVVGNTTLAEEGGDGQRIERAFVRVHGADGGLAFEQMLPIEADTDDSLSAWTVDVFDGTIAIGGSRFGGPAGIAHLWRLDLATNQIETNAVGDSFSSITSVVTAPEGRLFAAGYGGGTLPTSQWIWAFEAAQTASHWTITGEQGVFTSLALSRIEPAGFVAGVDPSQSPMLTPLAVCKFSR